MSLSESGYCFKIFFKASQDSFFLSKLAKEIPIFSKLAAAAHTRDCWLALAKSVGRMHSFHRPPA